MQRKMRDEIYKNIVEDDIPNLSHRPNCSYTTAFIAECMRYRYIVPSGVPHKATVDMEIGGHLIKKDTAIVAMLGLGMLDKDTWKDPDVFRPERFLDEKGRFITKPNALYIPFSAGRRSCPGEKLALADLFFVVSRFLQKTKGYEFVLPGGPGSVDIKGDIMQTGAWTPHAYIYELKKVY